MSHTRWGLRSLLAGLAAAGVVVAHTIAYLLAVPDPNLRAAFLFMTGHEGWSLVVAAAAGILTFGLSGFVISATTSNPRTETLTVRSIAIRLAGLQVIGFMALEMAERLLDGRSIAELMTEPVVVIGLLIQFAVAVAGAFLLVGFAWAVDTLLHRRWAPRPRRVRLSFRVPTNDWIPRIRAAADAASPRGPPVLI